MTRYEHLLFDLDNTLLDFDCAEKTAFSAAFSALGLIPDEATYETYHRINDGLWKMLERGEITRDRLSVQRFTMLLSEIGVPDNGLGERLSRAYFTELSHQRQLLPGAEEVCRKLSGEYHLHIITNGTDAVQKGRFYGSEIEPYFENVFISEQIGAAKPSPVFFRYVTERLGITDPSVCCVIGDSLTSDIAGANGAGMDAIWLCRGENADTCGKNVRAVIRDIRQLPEVLRGGMA